MSVWHDTISHPVSLAGTDGDLVSVSLAVDPRTLESLLECLASVPFPINPEIFHGLPTRVEFPAWASHLNQLRRALQSWGFDPSILTTRNMLEALAS